MNTGGNLRIPGSFTFDGHYDCVTMVVGSDENWIEESRSNNS